MISALLKDAVECATRVTGGRGCPKITTKQCTALASSARPRLPLSVSLALVGSLNNSISGGTRDCLHRAASLLATCSGSVTECLTSLAQLKEVEGELTRGDPPWTPSSRNVTPTAQACIPHHRAGNPVTARGRTWRVYQVIFPLPHAVSTPVAVRHRLGRRLALRHAGHLAVASRLPSGTGLSFRLRVRWLGRCWCSSPWMLGAETGRLDGRHGR